MSSCNYCRHRRCGEWADYCKKDPDTITSPEGVKETCYPRCSWESLEIFRKRHGGRCPYYSNEVLNFWVGIAIIVLGTILVGIIKRFLI